MDPTPFHLWPDRLAAAVARTSGRFTRSAVVEHVDSTQDEARRRRLPAGSVLTAWRQEAGRGRLDRSWADTGLDGTATTFVVGITAPERLSVGAAVAAARALDRFAPGRIGLKWPNDVMAMGRKVAGILVECGGGTAAIGVGVNVGQTTWPEAISHRAISLRELGAAIDRMAVVEALVEEMAAVEERPDADLAEEFSGLDVLCGTDVVLRRGDDRYRGRVIGVDPFHGIRLETAEGVRHLPAATTTVEPDA